ncbi:MAG: formylglycine-generating enzyme family protein [Thiohalomonadales bacterium]
MSLRKMNDCRIRIVFILVLLVSTNTTAIEKPLAISGDSIISENKHNMIRIPAGEAIVGSNKKENLNKGKDFGNVKAWYLDEHPQRKVKIDAFWIDKYEVSNEQYREYYKAVNVNIPDSWMEKGYVLSLQMKKLQSASVADLRKLAVQVFKLDLDTRKMSKPQLLDAMEKHMQVFDKVPVNYVSWFDAYGFCQWRGKRLPNEVEWERVARGLEGREFPWGNEWKPGMSHTGEEEWESGAAPVGSYNTDKTAEGVMDLAGNLSEWTNDWYQAYPGSDYKTADFGEKFKVARGAGWSGATGHYALKLFQRGAYRNNLDPEKTYDDVGFRCAVSEN